jgi:beta-lactam-binding protein with PASTA domain
LAIRAISILRRLSIIVAIGATFLFGLASTVYLSLRSPEVKVPEVIGKDRFDAERILSDAGLNFRVRATRPSNQSKPDTVLFQLPRAGEVVKVGQTVAMDISRAAKEGETAEGAATDKKVAEEQAVDSERSTDSNDNKPKRNRTANKNANQNANSNSSEANKNGSVNANANRSRTVNAGTNSNVNRAVEGGTEPVRNRNQNTEGRPPTPKPTPAARNTNTTP